jgi:hypothetical protein
METDIQRNVATSSSLVYIYIYISKNADSSILFQYKFLIDVGTVRFEAFPWEVEEGTPRQVYRTGTCCTQSRTV